MTENKQTTRLLMVDLTDEDVADRKNKLVKAESELQKVSAEKAEAMADFNSTLKDRRNEIRTLVAAIQTGSEEREVECYERRDEKRGAMETVRADTGEVIHDRPLTAEERQVDMFSGKPKGKRGKKAQAEGAEP